MPDFSKALRQLRPKETLQRQLFHSENPVSSLTRQLAYMKMHSPRRIDDVAIPGEEETTPLGRHLVIRKTYDGDHYHGTVRLGAFPVLTCSGS